MGIFSKLKFWKKEDDLGDLGLGESEPGGGLGDNPFAEGKDPFGDSSFPDIGAPGQQDMQQGRGTGQQAMRSSFDSAGFSQPHQMQQGFEQPDFNRPYSMSQAQPSQQLSSNYTLSKDIEVISSKLDAIRASLDIINQRLSNLERQAEREQVRKRTGW